MFRLHGSPISNFYNIVKLSLLEKGLEFEEVRRAPSQEEAFLTLSPMGKIPVLEVREGFLTETIAIVEFLEDVYPEISLYLTDPYDRALIRRLCHMAEIYIDLPARPLLNARMTRGELPWEKRVEISNQLEKGARAIARVASPSPWFMGSNFTLADIFLYYCLGLVAPLAQQQLGLDLYGCIPGAYAWREVFSQRHLTQLVDSANRVAMDRFLNRLDQAGSSS